MGAGLVQACHDLSEGGLAVAAAEMVIASPYGLDLDIESAVLDDTSQHDTIALFSESSSRFLVEVRPDDSAAFGAQMEGVEVALIGYVSDEPLLRVDGVSGGEVLRATAGELKAAWQRNV
jgi:phosphoribosylformylglycinamidine synthase subunit PurSL